MIAPLFSWWAKITIRAEAKTVSRGGEMVSDTVGGPTLHAFRRAATKVELAARARRSTADPTFRLANTNLRVAASRSDAAAARVLLQPSKKPARHSIGTRERLKA